MKKNKRYWRSEAKSQERWANHYFILWQRLDGRAGELQTRLALIERALEIALKRMNESEETLTAELKAWDKASDEALANAERASQVAVTVPDGDDANKWIDGRIAEIDRQMDERMADDGEVGT